jgi:hypothetical protein
VRILSHVIHLAFEVLYVLMPSFHILLLASFLLREKFQGSFSCFLYLSLWLKSNLGRLLGCSHRHYGVCSDSRRDCPHFIVVELLLALFLSKLFFELLRGVSLVELSSFPYLILNLEDNGRDDGTWGAVIESGTLHDTTTLLPSPPCIILMKDFLLVSPV